MSLVYLWLYLGTGWLSSSLSEHLEIRVTNCGHGRPMIGGDDFTPHWVVRTIPSSSMVTSLKPVV